MTRIKLTDPCVRCSSNKRALTQRIQSKQMQTFTKFFPEIHCLLMIYWFTRQTGDGKCSGDFFPLLYSQVTLTFIPSTLKCSTSRFGTMMLFRYIFGRLKAIHCLFMLGYCVHSINAIYLKMVQPAIRPICMNQNNAYERVKCKRRDIETHGKFPLNWPSDGWYIELI